jgi:hypothetical protein
VGAGVGARLRGWSWGSLALASRGPAPQGPAPRELLARGLPVFVGDLAGGLPIQVEAVR